MLIFIGLRGFVLTDYVSYYTVYENLSSLSKLNAYDLLRFEPGFIIYSSFIKTLGFNYFGWIFINTLIDLLVFRYFFKNYSPSLILPLICMLAFNGILMEFNLYRNIKAIELFLLSFPYLLKRKALPYFGLNLIGLTFHNSAFIYFPIYFLLTIKFNKIFIWGIIIFANLIYLCNISVISELINNLPFIQILSGYDKLDKYVNMTDMRSFSIGFFERLFSIIVFTVFREKLIAKHKYYIAIYNCYLLYYLCFMLLYEVPVLLQRIPTLFAFSYWILYPSIIYLHYKWRNVINFFISILLGLKIYASYSDPFYEYQNILWSEIDFTKSSARTQRMMDR